MFGTVFETLHTAGNDWRGDFLLYAGCNYVSCISTDKVGLQIQSSLC
jgi:hypothetical protein